MHPFLEEKSLNALTTEIYITIFYISPSIKQLDIYMDIQDHRRAGLEFRFPAWWLSIFEV